MPIPAGEVIAGRYKVARLVAEGGFGAVYLAEDNRLGNKVIALKEGFDKSPAAQEQFRLEAQLLANLQHPSLPRVTDYFLEPDGRQFLVMDYIEGRDLDQMVIEYGHALLDRRAAALLGQVCDAVAYLHTRKPQPVIHRDIKPANIKITAQGRAILVDFGIAKLYHPMKGTAKIAKAVTKYYSPPEQHIGKTDTRSDVYSLGATLYFATCMDLPPDAMDRLNQGAQVIAPSRLNPAISLTLEKIILKCLELNPDDRFSNANRLAAALRAFLNNQPVPLEPPGVACPRCGWRNRPGARYCVRDGAPLAVQVKTPAQASAQPRAAAPQQAAPPASGSPAPAGVSSSPLPVEMLFEMANEAARNKDYAKAIPRYEACLQKGFTDQAVYYNLGIAYLEVNRPADSVAVLLRGAGRYTKDADLQYQLAQAYRVQNMADKALQAVGKAARLNPKDAANLRLQGELLAEAGRWGEAVPPLEKSLQIEPDSYVSNLLIGRAFGEIGELKKASQALNRAAKCNSQKADPYIWMGIFFLRAQKNREAVTALESAVRVEPGAAAAQAWLGEAWIRQAQYVKALPYFEKAVALDPQEPGHYARLGQCYVLLKRRTQAVAALQEALKLDPSYQLARDWLKKI